MISVPLLLIHRLEILLLANPSARRRHLFVGVIVPVLPVDVLCYFGRCLPLLVSTATIAAPVAHIGCVGRSRGDVIVVIVLLHLLITAAMRQSLPLPLEDLFLFSGSLSGIVYLLSS